MKWRLTGLLIALGVVISDQLTKWWIMAGYLRLTESDFATWLISKAPQHNFVVREITSFLNIVMVWNPGVSFGMLQTAEYQHYAAYGLTGMAIVIALGFAIWLWRMPNAIRAFAVGLIVGGAIGNVWDRVRFGAVADFIDVHVAGWHWPAFNVADSAICIGVVLLLIETFFLLPEKEITEKK